jgi:integrase
MPKHPGVSRKGKKWYGSKWWKGKSYNTRLCDTAEEAAYLREKLIKRLQKGLDIDKSKTTVKDFVSVYLEKYLYKKPKLQEITISQIERNLKNCIIPAIGDKKLRDLTPEDMQDLQNIILSRYQPSSARVILSQFKRILKRATIWHYIEYNPALSLDTIDVIIEKPQVLTNEQIASLIYNEKIDLKIRAIVAVAYLTGMRKSEIFGLMWEKIDFKEKTIQVDLQYCKGRLKSPKRNSARIIPILPELEPILKEWKLQCGSIKWVFPGRSDKPLASSTWVHLHLNPLLKELDLPTVRFHSFRHAFDALLHDLGIPTREIMQIMGHKTVDMSMLYDRASSKHLVKVTRDVKVFNDAFLRNSLRIQD